jgi:hypothetical protein
MVLRIVDRVAVSIEGLGIARLRDDWIRTDEARNLAVIVARAVIIEPRLRIEFLACEAVRRVTGRLRAGGGTLGSRNASPPMDRIR